MRVLALISAIVLSQCGGDSHRQETFLKGKGVKLYYNRTMALLYNIDPETIDSSLTPLGLKEMAALFASVDRSIGY